MKYATRGGGILNAHTTITPMKAAQLVEAAGIADGKRIIADFAAVGFVKSYALSIETLDASGVGTVVLGSKIPKTMWKRIVQAGCGSDVWSSGTVHLAGAAIITGITFKPDSIDWLIAHHTDAPPPSRGKRKMVHAPEKDGPQPIEAVTEAASAADDEKPLRRKPDPSAIPPGALVATMKQTETALGISRGTVYNLIDRGKLVRVEGTSLRSVKIEAASVRALAGSAA